jgi:hypothetical protein
VGLVELEISNGVNTEGVLRENSTMQDVDMSIVERLLKEGAEVNAAAQNENGRTGL